MATPGQGRFECRLAAILAAGMRRREFIALFAGTLATWSLAARAQQAVKIARIGFLGAASASGFANRVEVLRAGLRDLGYVEGKNIVIEFRWADGKYDRLPELAVELARLKLDVLLTHGAPGTLAAKAATTTIPIVMVVAGDAVATGLVASLARPGGNVTGSTFFNPELMAKRLEVLKEAIPRITQIAALLNPDNSVSAPSLQAMATAAQSLKAHLLRFDVREPNQFENAFTAMAKRGINAVVVHEDAMFLANDKPIADLAAKKRIPSIGSKEFAEAGGLIGYGVNLVELYRRAAVFVDKILKGARPTDLPVEQPTKFEFVVNLKTARALGLNVPPSLLARADEVIE
jgi:putative tryptophan/tyrosine transport system substrate-binding protein